MILPTRIKKICSNEISVVFLQSEIIRAPTFTSKVSSVMHTKSDDSRIYAVTMKGVLVNTILTAFKFTAAILGHSAAMLADAAHSLSDLVTDFIVLLFVRIGRKAVSSRKVGYQILPSAMFEITFLLFNRLTRPVAYVLFHSGKRIEKC